MVRHIAFRWTLATLAVLGARVASADPISFTGTVAQDFSPSNPSVHIAGADELFDDPNPLNRIYQLPEMTAQGLINGWAIKDIRTSYDAASDTLSVGLNTFSIAGRAVGAGAADIEALVAQHGGIDPPQLGGRKSITVAFAPNNPDGSLMPGEPVIVAGVPAEKSAAGPGIDGFTVARYKGLVTQGIANNYGKPLPGNLARWPTTPPRITPDSSSRSPTSARSPPGSTPPRASGSRRSQAPPTTM